MGLGILESALTVIILPNAFIIIVFFALCSAGTNLGLIPRVIPSITGVWVSRVVPARVSSLFCGVSLSEKSVYI